MFILSKDHEKLKSEKYTMTKSSPSSAKTALPARQEGWLASRLVIRVQKVKGID